MALRVRLGFIAAVLVATGVAASALAASTPAHAPPALSLKAGEEVTIPISIQGAGIALGAPRISKLGTAKPAEGEITIGLTPGDKTLYAQVIVTENTSAPIDLVATGLIGEIKIDERVICGRLDQPVTMHIGSVSWRVWLHDFEIGKGADCS